MDCLLYNKKDMKPLLLATVLLMSALGSSKAEDKLYLVSLISLTSASVADAATSWGHPEQNRLIGSTFGSRGVAIKVAVIGGQLALNHFVLRRIHDSRDRARARRNLTIVNFAAAGLTGGMALRNLRMR